VLVNLPATSIAVYPSKAKLPSPDFQATTLVLCGTTALFQCWISFRDFPKTTQQSGHQTLVESSTARHLDIRLFTIYP